MLESSAIVWRQYWTILGNTRKYYNCGQPCPKCLCTGEQGRAYLKLLTRSVWLHSPFTKVPFLFASWGSNFSMELYGKIQIIPSIEHSYGKFSNKLLGGFIGNGFKCLRNQVHMPFSFYRMRGRSGPVSESKFELKTLKVSNDTLNVSAPLIFQLHDKNHKNKTVFFLLDILLWRDHNFK